LIAKINGRYRVMLFVIINKKYVDDEMIEDPYVYVFLHNFKIIKYQHEAYKMKKKLHNFT